MLVDEFEQNKDSFMKSVQDSFEKICKQNHLRKPYPNIEITFENLDSDDPSVEFSLVEYNLKNSRGADELVTYQCLFTDDGVIEDNGSLIAENLPDFIDGVAFYMADRYDYLVNYR